MDSFHPCNLCSKKAHSAVATNEIHMKEPFTIPFVNMNGEERSANKQKFFHGTDSSTATPYSLTLSKQNPLKT